MSIIGPKVPIMLQSAHLPQIPVCSGAHVSWCPFPQVPICPQCLLVPMPMASKVLVCPITCPKYPFAPVTSCPYNCAHFSWCPFPQVPICPQCLLAPMPIGLKSSCLSNYVPQIPICPGDQLPI